jgi:putative Mn2+ efflux pump MntP
MDMLVVIGLFQAVMPIIGWAAGMRFKSLIRPFDHWIAFGLLAFIGIKMLIETRSLDTECRSRDCTHFPTLIVLSLAKSIDALAVGISFAVLNIQILLPILIIGAVTFILCVIGIYIGNRIGHLFENKIQLIGGVVLIGIGMKILIEHLIQGV